MDPSHVIRSSFNNEADILKLDSGLLSIMTTASRVPFFVSHAKSRPSEESRPTVWAIYQAAEASAASFAFFRLS